VFVRCDRGIFILNAADARVYNNTFFDAPASFQRDQRSATGDHFGWHPATGPGVDQREGHVFVNNLMVAAENSRRPLLRFEQPAALCKQLTQSQARQIDGNVYVRTAVTGTAGAPPMVTWSPTASDSCQTSAATLDQFRSMARGYEAAGRQVDATPRSVFKSPELGRYESLPMLGAPGGAATPPDILKLLGWPEKQAGTQGAYPR
jgi:hypothetical protein